MHGQRCTCALKKELTLDSVPETGFPSPQPALLSESKAPQLTSTKSESTLTVFRDGHHKPVHKHNDMAHKCGLPYTIPRSHTIHSTSDIHHSVDHWPMALPPAGDLSQRVLEYAASGPQRRAKSEQDSPECAPVMPMEDGTTSVPPLDLSSFFPSAPSAQSPLDEPSETPSARTTMSTTFGGSTLDPIVTSVPPVDTSFPSFPTADTSPSATMALQDSYSDPFFASPDTDLQLGSAGFSAPSVDWSSFPLYSSDVRPPTSTQTPSYASFDYNSVHPTMPPPSSSGDISEVDEYGPVPGLGNSSSDLQSVAEDPEMDQYRVSSASSFAGMPQAQLLASENLESIDIDDFLKSANQSTAAIEHQLQANNMSTEPKSRQGQSPYGMSQAEQDYKRQATPTTSCPMTTSPTDAIWPSNDLFGAGSTMDGNLFSPSWSR